VGGLWVQLGKIKCAAKALACVSACSSFNFVKCWHFVVRFIVHLMLVVSSATLTPNGQGLLQGWNSLLVWLESLLIKDIKVQVNKQKPNNVRPAQMKHNSDKMTIAPMSSQPCSKPDVVRSPFSLVQT
jgi:hypothetical protein